MAATFWVGGMLFLSLVAVPNLRKADDPLSAQQWFVSLARRFRSLVWMALFILIVTGIFLLSGVVPNFSSPWTWPSSVLLKLFLVLALIGTSFFHDQVVGPKVRTLKRKSPMELSPKNRILIRLSPLLGRVTMLLGLSVLWAAVMIGRG